VPLDDQHPGAVPGRRQRGGQAGRPGADHKDVGRGRGGGGAHRFVGCHFVPLLARIGCNGEER
jgi:hypothetical protein